MSESALGKADSGSEAKGKFATVVCPTCERDDFKSNRGMRRHHAMAHGESLSEVEFECNHCGDDFTIPVAWVRKDRNSGAYCSKECRDIDKDIGIEKEDEVRTCKAPDCDGSFEVIPSSPKQFCSLSCAYGNRSNNEAHTQNCEICGEEYKTGGPKKAQRRVTCGVECFKEWLTGRYRGEKSFSWKGGYDQYYGDNWQEQRNKARERDGYQCQVCGISESDNPRQLSVHHVTPVREFEQPEDANVLTNLVTLCEPCHSKWEGLYLRPDTRHRE